MNIIVKKSSVKNKKSCAYVEHILLFGPIDKRPIIYYYIPT